MEERGKDRERQNIKGNKQKQINNEIKRYKESTRDTENHKKQRKTEKQWKREETREIHNNSGYGGNERETEKQ